MRLTVGALLGVLATAGDLSAQDSLVQVDGKVAFLYMNETPCAHGTGTGGLTLGLNARSRGRVGVSASADLLLSGVLVRSDECIGVGPAGPLWTYGVTSYRPGARVSLGLGYDFPVVAAVHSELGA